MKPAARRPPWPSEDPPGRPGPFGAVFRLAQSRAAPAEGHARGGTRRTLRPGRARQPDLLPLKGSGPDGGVAPELRESAGERQAALRATRDQDGRC